MRISGPWINRAGWCLTVATLLSALSIVPIIADRTPDWIGWFGAPGAVVSFLILHWIPSGSFLMPLFVGVVVNVLILGAGIFGVVLLVSRFRRRITRA
jgi:hypothetical protein